MLTCFRYLSACIDQDMRVALGYEDTMMWCITYTYIKKICLTNFNTKSDFWDFRYFMTWWDRPNDWPQADPMSYTTTDHMTDPMIDLTIDLMIKPPWLTSSLTNDWPCYWPHDWPHDRPYDQLHDQPHDWPNDWPQIDTITDPVTIPITDPMTVSMTDQNCDVRASSHSYDVCIIGIDLEGPAHIMWDLLSKTKSWSNATRICSLGMTWATGSRPLTLRATYVTQHQRLLLPASYSLPPWM